HLHLGTNGHARSAVTKEGTVAGSPREAPPSTRGSPPTPFTDSPQCRRVRTRLPPGPETDRSAAVFTLRVGVSSVTPPNVGRSVPFVLRPVEVAFELAGELEAVAPEATSRIGNAPERVQQKRLRVAFDDAWIVAGFVIPGVIAPGEREVEGDRPQ